MDEIERRVDDVRARSSEIENTLIDELRAGRLSRRDFVRRGTVLGMSMPVLGFLVSACGSGETDGGGDAAATPDASQVQQGGTLRTAIQDPAGNLDPILVNNQGGLATIGQTGEYLAFSNNRLQLEPRVAERWEPNQDGSEWTFTIREGITFHDGSPLEAEDVAETFNRLADPENSSNALSALAGALSAGGAEARDARTVVFTLDAPTGNFPYYTSSDNYNAIILPRDYDGNWEETFIGSAGWRLDSFRQGQGVSLVPYQRYWNQEMRPRADRSEIRFYAREQAQVLALQGNEVDIVAQYSVSGGRALVTDPNVRTLESRTSVHRQVHMRTDREPFRDPRTRRAVALLINRRALVDGLFDGKADIGNDSPFAPVYPSTDRSVPQRQQDVAQARELLAAAGQEDGFEVQLRTHEIFELPDLAQLIQNDLRQANIRVNLQISDTASYYGDATFGSSDWLDSTFGITEYGHRGVPDIFLKAPLQSDGVWNAAHFDNPQYDRLVRDYVGALDPQTQRRTASQIQRLLLEETPIVFPYFYFYLTGTRPNVAGVQVSAMGHVELEQAGFTS